MIDPVALATLGVAALTALAVVVNSVTAFTSSSAARQAAERAEARAIEAVRVSESNAQALRNVATSSQLDGQLTTYRRLVREEADSKIAAAERKAEQAFLRGVEHAQSNPLATEATSARIEQKIDDAAGMVAAAAAAATQEAGNVKPELP